MSPPPPTDPGDSRHVAHVFGDSIGDTLPDGDVEDRKKVWDDLESTTVDDWQMLFARTYGAHRGAA